MRSLENQFQFVQDERIPFVKLDTQWTEARLPLILREIEQLYRSSQYILGNPVEQFERKLSEVTGVPYVVAVNSGLDALLLSLRALGVGPGDEVITVSNSFIATVAAIDLVGAVPVFVDVGEDFLMDIEQLEEKISSKTKAILPVHLTGKAVNMSALMRIAEQYDLKVIEDAAQAILATHMGVQVGAWGDTGAFSLHPLKNLHVWGDGGFITTKDEKIYQNLKLQRNHGLINRDQSAFFSYNSRLDTLQAIVGNNLLDDLEDITHRRRENARIYRDNLSILQEWVQLPDWSSDPKNRSVFHVFQIQVSCRDELKKYLEDLGIETKIHYPIPIHLQPAAKKYGTKPWVLPNTERLSQKILSLPIRESLTSDEIRRICHAVRSFFLPQ